MRQTADRWLWDVPESQKKIEPDESLQGTEIEPMRISNLRKAAIVVAALGEELAVEVCSRLSVNQVLELSEEIKNLDKVPAEEIDRVLEEFLQSHESTQPIGGNAYARQLLDGALGSSRPFDRFDDHDEDERNVFSRLNELKPVDLWQTLRNEDTQTIAAVVGHLTHLKAGELISHLDETQAADVLYRAAHLGAPSPGAMQCLVAALDMEMRIAHGSVGSKPEAAVQFVVDLLGGMPPARSKEMLTAIGEVDRQFGESVAELVFTFEDIVNLTDLDLQAVLRHADMNTLVMALKGTEGWLRDRVKSNLSSRGRQRLDEELEMLGAVPVSSVQEAQREIIHQARELAEQGEINLIGRDTEYIE